MQFFSSSAPSLNDTGYSLEQALFNGAPLYLPESGTVTKPVAPVQLSAPVSSPGSVAMPYRPEILIAGGDYAPAPQKQLPPPAPSSGAMTIEVPQPSAPGAALDSSHTTGPVAAGTPAAAVTGSPSIEAGSLASTTGNLGKLAVALLVAIAILLLLGGRHS